MTKTARRSLVALAGFFLLLTLLLVIAAMLVESRWARGLLEEQISQRAGGREVVIGELDVDWDWPLGIHLGEFSIANADWAEHEQMLELAGLDVTVNVGELMAGTIDLARIDMTQPVIHLARRADGTTNWDDLVPDEVDAEDVQQAAAEAPPGIQPDTVSIRQGQLTYQDARLDADVNVNFQTASDGANQRRLEVQAEGQIQGRLLQFGLQGGAPSRALSAEKYTVTLTGHLGDMELGFDGQLHNVQRFESLQGQINASVPEKADLASLLGQPALTIPSVDFQAQLNHEGQRWAMEAIEAQVGESRLTGLLALEQGDTPRFDVQLDADQLDLNRWGVMDMLETQEPQAAETAPEEATEDQGVSAIAAQESESEGDGDLAQRLAQQLAPLRKYAGQVEVTVGQLRYGDETLRDIGLEAQLDNGRLDLQQLRILQDDGKLTGQGWLDVQSDSLEGSLDTQVDQFDLGQALAPLGLTELGVLDGEVHARFTQGVLTLQESQLTYRAPAQDLSVQVSAESLSTGNTTVPGTQAPGVHLEGSGTRSGQDFSFELNLGSLLDLNNLDTPSSVQGTLTAGETSLQVEGTLTQPLDPAAVDVSLQVDSSNLASVNRLTGLALPTGEPFHLQGRLLREPQEQRWAVQDLEAQLGDSQLTGAVTLAQGATPRFDMQLHADQLDLDRWGITDLLGADGQQESEPDQDQGPLQQRLAEQLASLRRYQGQVDVSIGQLSYADEVLRDVALQGQLDNGRLAIERLHAVQGGGELTAQGWLDVQPETVSGAMDVQVDQVDLGQALAPFGLAELGTLDGELHARLTADALTLDDTQLTYDAPAQALSVQLTAEARDTAGTQASGVSIEGSGHWHDAPFRFDLVLGALPGLSGVDRAIPVEGRVASRETTLYVDGTIYQPLGSLSVDTQLRLVGPSPADLNPLLGQELPELPAYQLQGRLRWHDTLLRLTGLQGEFGDSDINGDIRFEWEGRSTLWATLHSRQLNERDLDVLWASEDEAEEEAQLFSEEPLNLESLRSMDVVVDYSATNANARNIPLSDVQLEAELRQGVLTLDPVRIGVGGGELSARFRADARQALLDGELELSLSRVELTPLIRKAELPETAEGASEDSAGILGGKGQMSFQGRSVAELMASLDGTLEFAVSRGYLDMLVVELLGLDVGEALVGSLADADQVPMQCAYARLAAESGLTKLEQFYVGTQDTNFLAGGTIDLNTEQLDLTFEAHPKDASLLESASPVSLEGRLSDPQVSVVSPELLARGAATVIGAFIAPPLAILPWVEPGLGEGVGPGCRQALEDYETADEQTYSEQE